METVIDGIIGKKYGRWTVLEYLGKDKYRQPRCKCRCDCGTEKIVHLRNIQSGKSQSCGCIPSEMMSDKERQKMLREAAKITIATPESKAKRSAIATKIANERVKSGEMYDTFGMQDGTNITNIKSKKARVDNSTGVRNVRKDKRRNTYFVRICFQGEVYSEYGFHSIKEAEKARQRMYEEIVEPYLESVGRA